MRSLVSVSHSGARLRTLDWSLLRHAPSQGRPTRWAPSAMREHCELTETTHAKAAVEYAAQAERHLRMASETAASGS
jgi:hypothetical protein